MVSADVKNAHGATEWPAIHVAPVERVPDMHPWIHAATSTTPYMQCMVQDGFALRLKWKED